MDEPVSGEPELFELNRRLAEAERTCDVATLAQLLASDYEGVDPGGRRFGKMDALARFSSPELVIRRLETSEVRVRRQGEVALVAGVTEMEGSYQTEPFAGTFRYLDVWLRRGEAWELVASQMTAASAP